MPTAADPSGRAKTAVVLLFALALVTVGCKGIPQAAPRPPMQFDHPNPNGPPAPLAVYIHGGAWIMGDKLSDAFYGLVKPRLLAQGVAVASIDYRLAPKNRFPAQINDVTYAVRYLRANAKKLRLDPDRIAVFGTSAGGHLASLLGTIDQSAGFDVGPLKNVSSRVRAVVDIVGPADLTDPAIPQITDVAIQSTFGVAGGTPGDPALIKASPANYVSAGDPPFLIVHGTLDELVPYSQSVAFSKQLQAAGVRSELVSVVGGTHALSSPGQSVTPNQIVERITTFLVTELRR